MRRRLVPGEQQQEQHRHHLVATDALPFLFNAYEPGEQSGAAAQKFKAWRPAFWDNLAMSVELHKINRVIVIDHRDCGAVKLACRAESIATPEIETATYRKILREFREALAKRHPHLGAETGLMALDGTFEALG
jgi:carbonic anhydrase